MWGLIQGRIDPHLDKHPVDTAYRESYEEGAVRKEDIDTCYHYLGETHFSVPQPYETGYSQGGYYVMVGFKLKPGADVSVTPPPQYEQALSDRHWCSSLDDAIEFLQLQPGVKNITTRLRMKIQGVLIPALRSIFHPQAQEFMHILDPIM